MVHANPNRATRPCPQSLGDGEEDHPYGSRARRPSNAQSSQQQHDSEEGPRFCLDRSTIPCPPLLHCDWVHDVMAPSVIDVEGRAIDPGIVRHSPIRIGAATMNHVL
jgi:hypothetical protein